MEKLKNLVKQIGEKIKNGWKKAIGVGVTVVCGAIGVILSAVLVTLVLGAVLAITCGTLALVAFVAVFLANLLGLGQVWAAALFLALVYLLWHK